jgi:hypothetical protein
VLNGDDAIFRTPDDERRHHGGQVELIGRAHRLTTGRLPAIAGTELVSRPNIGVVYSYRPAV